MMPAHIVETAENAIAAANRNNRLVSHSERDEVAWLFNLIHSPNQLPGVAEHRALFQLENSRINIPRRWNGRRFRQRGPVVIEREDLGYRSVVHVLFLQQLRAGSLLPNCPSQNFQQLAD